MKERSLSPATVLATLAMLLVAAPSVARREGGKAAAAPASTAGSALQLAAFEHAWKRIREIHYDEAMNGIDWDGAREELLPRARTARTAEELRPVLQDLIAKLGESHYQVIPGAAYARLESVSGVGEEPGGTADLATADHDSPGSKGKQGDLGLDARLAGSDVLITRVEPDGPADRAGIRPGWMLTAIGDRSLLEVLAVAREALADERLAVIHANIAVAHALSGAPGSVAKLELKRPDGLVSSVDVRRRLSEGEVNQLGNLPPLVAGLTHGILPGTNVGYIRFNIFLTPITARFSAAMAEFIDRDVDAVIIDLRGNPGGIGAMVMGLAGHLIAEPGQSLGTMRMRGSKLNFVAIPKAPAARFAGPVAVLVDELSMSTSELFAAGLQATGRAIVVGTTSAGMALPSVIESLPNGDRLQMAFADLTGPAGVRIEGKGVVPDVPVARTKESFASAQDPVIAAALGRLASGGASRTSAPSAAASPAPAPSPSAPKGMP